MNWLLQTRLLFYIISPKNPYPNLNPNPESKYTYGDRSTRTHVNPMVLYHFSRFSHRWKSSTCVWICFYRFYPSFDHTKRQVNNLKSNKLLFFVTIFGWIICQRLCGTFVTDWLKTEIKYIEMRQSIDKQNKNSQWSPLKQTNDCSLHHGNDDKTPFCIIIFR